MNSFEQLPKPLLFLLAFSLLLSSCGGISSSSASTSFPTLSPTPAPAANPYAVIEGDWHIAGTNSFGYPVSPDPYVGIVIGVIGDSIYARGVLSVHCNSGLGISTSIVTTAQIAPDRTFVLTNPTGSSSGIQFTIRGTVPSNGESVWQGSYKLLNSESMTNCTLNQSVNFTATQYQPIQGTYSGALTGNGFAADSTIELQIAQGTREFLALGTTQYVYLPLSGTVSITGSPCFTKGTFSGSTNNLLLADQLLITITAADGSQLAVRGWFADQSEMALTPFTVNFMGGACSGQFANAKPSLQP